MLIKQKKLCISAILVIGAYCSYVLIAYGIRLYYGIRYFAIEREQAFPFYPDTPDKDVIDRIDIYRWGLTVHSIVALIFAIMTIIIAIFLIMNIAKSKKSNIFIIAFLLSTAALLVCTFIFHIFYISDNLTSGSMNNPDLRDELIDQNTWYVIANIFAILLLIVNLALTRFLLKDFSLLKKDEE